jgi:hypothetical protein
MRLRKIFLALAGVVVLLGTSLVGSSGALGTASISPNPIPVVDGQLSATVTLNWSGQKPSTLISVRICRKSIADPTFSVGVDCSLASDITPNGTADGAGTVQYDVFRGENPDGDNGSGSWGCFAASDPPVTAVQKNTTCYVRVTNNSINNNADATETAYTFSAGAPVVPEAPLSILLPVLGGAVAVGAFFFLRRRTAPA